MIRLPQSWLKRWQGRDPFEEIFALKGTVYREKKGRRTLEFVLGGKHYFAKLHWGTGWLKLISNRIRFRPPELGAENEWRAIRRLEALGIPTTPLVGYGRRGRNPARMRSFVITKALRETISLEEVCEKWPESPPDCTLKRTLIARVADIARTLHENGMNHRDLYICHFLLDISMGLEHIDPRNPILHLIDLHRVQFRHRTPVRWRIKDVAALYFSSMEIGLTRRDLYRFMKRYRNMPLRETLSADKSFWTGVVRRGVAFYEEYQRKDRRRNRIYREKTKGAR